MKVRVTLLIDEDMLKAWRAGYRCKGGTKREAARDLANHLIDVGGEQIEEELYQESQCREDEKRREG